MDDMGFRPNSELEQTPNRMYFPRVYAKTQFKSKSLKPRKTTIKENSREWHVISQL